MSKLSFLQNIALIAVDQPVRRSGGGKRKEWNPPTGLAVRLWKDGRVFPSQALVDKFDLEYRPRLTEEQITAIKEGTLAKPFPGRGFDVADSEEFEQFKTDVRLLIVSPVEKDAGKVELFSACSYQEDGITPKTSVMDQGTHTFGRSFLVPAVEAIYGIKFKTTEANGEDSEEGVEYVDLVFVGKPDSDLDDPQPFRLPPNKSTAFLPKRLSRGEKAGELTVVTRKNPELYVLYPKCLLQDEEPADAGIISEVTENPIQEC